MANDDEEEEDEDQDRDENGDAAGIDESTVMDEIEEADSTADENQHQVDFDATDHTDLYTAKRDRDRAWEQARKGAKGFLDENQGHRVRIVTRRASERRKASSGNNYEHGTWVQIGQSHAFVSKHSEAFKNPDSGLYTTTAADDNLRAALGL